MKIPLPLPRLSFSPLGPVEELFDCSHCGYYPIDPGTYRCPRCKPTAQLDLPLKMKKS